MAPLTDPQSVMSLAGDHTASRRGLHSVTSARDRCASLRVVAGQTAREGQADDLLDALVLTGVQCYEDEPRKVRWRVEVRIELQRLDFIGQIRSPA